MALTKDELSWLEEIVTETRNALRSKGMSCKLADHRPPILTPNAALITFKGDSSLTLKKISAAESELLTTYAIPILAITQGVGTISIAVQRNPRAILKSKEIFSDILKDPDYDSQSEDIFVGVREEDGKPQFMDLFTEPHTLVSGTTGSGKSVLLQNIITYIGVTRSADDAHIYLVDGKDGVDYGALVDLPHLKNGCGKIVTEKEESIDLITELQEEMERRYGLFKNSGTVNLKSYRKKTGKKLPTIFYIQDEFAAWMLDKEYSDAISRGVSQIGVKARAAGIFLIFGLQRPDNTVVPMQLRDQLGNRLTLKVSDSGTAQIATQEKNSGAEKLLGKGHMIAKIGGQLISIQVPFIDPDEEIRPLVKILSEKYKKEQQDAPNKSGLIYADANATTPLSSEVVDAMAPYWATKFFNPSSLAGEKFGSEHPVRLATIRLATLLGGEHTNYTLTSGATEANNWALDLAIKRALKSKATCRILVSEIEHPAILQAAQHRTEHDDRIKVESVKVSPDGVVDVDDLMKKLNPDIDLVSIMLANNESGVIQPLKEIAHLVKKTAPSCLVHTDATQAVGKIHVDLEIDLAEVDILSLSAHKFGGPKELERYSSAT